MHNKHRPIIGRPRGDPPLIFDAQDDVPQLQNNRDGTFREGFNFRLISGVFRPGGSGLPENKFIVQSSKFQVGWWGKCQEGEMADLISINRWQNHYPLPSGFS